MSWIRLLMISPCNNFHNHLPDLMTVEKIIRRNKQQPTTCLLSLGNVVYILSSWVTCVLYTWNCNLLIVKREFGPLSVCLQWLNYFQMFHSFILLYHSFNLSTFLTTDDKHQSCIRKINYKRQNNTGRDRQTKAERVHGDVLWVR